MQLPEPVSTLGSIRSWDQVADVAQTAIGCLHNFRLLTVNHCCFAAGNSLLELTNRREDSYPIANHGKEERISLCYSLAWNYDCSTISLASSSECLSKGGTKTENTCRLKNISNHTLPRCRQLVGDERARKTVAFAYNARVQWWSRPIQWVRSCSCATGALFAAQLSNDFLIARCLRREGVWNVFSQYND